MGSSIGYVTAETITPNDDEVAACDHQRQLDHIDQMCHDIQRILSELEPFLPMLMKRASLLAGFGRKGRTDG